MRLSLPSCLHTSARDSDSEACSIRPKGMISQAPAASIRSISPGASWMLRPFWVICEKPVRWLTRKQCWSLSRSLFRPLRRISPALVRRLARARPPRDQVEISPMNSEGLNVSSVSYTPQMFCMVAFQRSSAGLLA
ncbi:hypothetical protein D3C79_927030 [compost metagenome]